MTKLQPLSDEQRQQIGTLVTTEHFTLQTARSATISDANGRASLFLSTVSSALVALAFTGQIDNTMATFFTFSFVLFPALIFLGIATFARVLQSAIEDIVYAREISRLRHLYTELVPQIAPYLLTSTSDDMTSVVRGMSVAPGRWQMFLTTAGMIGVINSMLLGVLAGLAANRFGVVQWASIVAGIVVFAVSVFLHQRYQGRRWDATQKQIPVLFPNDQ